MKKSFVTLSLLISLCTSRTALSCSFCNSMLGINPYFSPQNRIALNMMYQRSSIEGLVGAGTGQEAFEPLYKRQLPDATQRITHDAGGTTASERRYTAELSYQHHATRNLLFTALIPYTSLITSGEESSTSSGFGDISLIGQYIVRTDVSDDWSVALLIGGGLKVPTGKNNVTALDGDRIHYDAQPGTNSWDFILNSSAFLQNEDILFAVDIFGKFNTKNSFNEKIGNTFSITTAANKEFTRDEDSGFALVGIAGARFEREGKYRVGGITVSERGSSVVYGTLGGQVVLGFLSINVTGLVPVVQQLPSGGFSEGLRAPVGVQLAM